MTYLQNQNWFVCFKFTYKLEMVGDQNLCECDFTIYVNREICEWQFSIYFMILNEKLAFCVNSHESAKITEIGQDKDFTI